MMNKLLLVTIPVVGVLFFQSFLSIINVVFCIVVGFLGFLMGVSLVTKSFQHKPRIDEPNLSSHMFLRNLMASRQKSLPSKKNIVISHNLDAALQEIIDLTLRDFVKTWYCDVGQNELIYEHIKKDLWTVISNLSDRLSQLDMVTLIAQDMVLKLYSHFQEIRYAIDRPKSGYYKSKFLLHPWLVNDERETEFLRKATEVFLLHCLPANYAFCSTSRHLLREIFTMKVLKPTVQLICDPDYINLLLLSYLDYKEKLVEDTKKRYQYAASYEDFVKMINQCHDLEMLKQIRYNIMSEIMQATTINNIKKAKGIDTKKEQRSTGTKKGDLLKARNLKRYINELTVSKTKCEKRIQQLGGLGYAWNMDSTQPTEDNILPGKKVLAFNVIMEAPRAQSYFMQYLRKEHYESLLGFWLGVESLKHTDKALRHHVAGEIYHMYIASPSTGVKLDRALIKEMESFLTGDSLGPKAFYNAQKIIYHELEEHHYPSFLVCDIYHRYIRTIDAEGKDDDDDDDLDIHEKKWIDSVRERASTQQQLNDSTLLQVQSTYTGKKLEKLDEKIQRKMQALDGMRHSMKPDPKSLKVQEDITRELHQLRQEKSQLEFHIERTAVWCDDFGKWRTRMDSATVIQDEETGRYAPYFTIIIYQEVSPLSTDDRVQGWVVSRSLSEFHRLHANLVQIGPWLCKKVLPTMRKFRQIDEKFLERCKISFGDYLAAVLKDDRMTHSEALYAFLSPSPENLKQTITGDKKKFSIGTILKNLGGSDSDDDQLLFDDEGLKEDIQKDSIAEPLYSLISEIFQLKGLFKLVRRTLMAFVQVTFGSTINKQLRTIVDWIFSEPMLIYYINSLRDSLWPDGQLAEWAAPRSDEEKLKTRLLAKQKLLDSFPEFMKNLVGEESSRHGTIKVFECLQDVRLNKQLFYVLLEILLLEVCPELKEEKNNKLQNPCYQNG